MSLNRNCSIKRIFRYRWYDRQWQDCAIITTWFNGGFRHCQPWHFAAATRSYIWLQRRSITVLQLYVEDRMQSVHLNGSISRPRRIFCRVLQGSIVGPLLFILYRADIDIIVQSFYLKHHTYADNNQIYSWCCPAKCASSKIKIVDCIDVVDKWMASNWLMLNPSKSEYLWCSSPHRFLLIDQSAFVRWDSSVDVSSVMGNLGAFFDVTMSMNEHTRPVKLSSYYQLRQIKSIRHALPTATMIQLVNSFIISRVDYCNSILAGIPKYQLDWLQSILNVAVRLIFGYTGCRLLGYSGCGLLSTLISSDAWRCSKCCMVSPQVTSRTIVSKSRQTSGDRVCILQVATVWMGRLHQRPSRSENVHLGLAAQLCGTPCQTL